MGSIKKILAYTLGTIMVLFLVSFFNFSNILSTQYNLVLTDTPIEVSESTKALHQTLTIADLHADALLSTRDLTKRSKLGHIDVPRLQEGNVAFQAFTVVTQAPAGMNEFATDPDDTDLVTIQAVSALWPMNSWGDNLERALFQAKKLHRFAEKSDGKLRVIRTKEDLQKLLSDRESDPSLIAGLLGLEGFHMGELSAVDAMYEAGFRMMAPTHFFDSYMGGSAHGLEKGGLTPFGYDVIRRMQELGVALDLSHASPTMLDDVIRDFPDIPKIISHTGVKGTCNRMRNMSDHHLRAIADVGGVIGIGFWPVATCGESVLEIADAIDYTVNLLGADHVGLGSDYDGMVQTPFDAAGMDQLTQELVNREYSHEDIAKIMGGNTIRFFLENLPSE